MKAMVINRIASLQDQEAPLAAVELPVPEPEAGEIRIKVCACGVCHTELDEIEGRTAPPRLPVVPGHEVVGRVDKRGSQGDQIRHRRAGWGRLDPFVLRDCRREPEPAFPRHGPRRQRRVRPVHDGAGDLCLPDSGGVLGCGSGTPAVCRRRRLPLTAARRDRGRSDPRADRVWRLGPSRAAARPSSLSEHGGLRVRPRSRGARLRARAGGGLGGRHCAAFPRAAARDHRHHTRLEARGRGPGQPQARRPSGDQRHPQGGRGQGPSDAAQLSAITYGWRRRSSPSPT